MKVVEVILYSNSRSMYVTMFKPAQRSCQQKEIQTAIAVNAGAVSKPAQNDSNPKSALLLSQRFHHSYDETASWQRL